VYKWDVFSSATLVQLIVQKLLERRLYVLTRVSHIIIAGRRDLQFQY